MQIELSIAKGFSLVFDQPSDTDFGAMIAAINERPLPQYADEVNDYACDIVRAGCPIGSRPPVYLSCPDGSVMRLEV